MTKEEIKSCPFCGAKGVIESTKVGYYWIRCKEYCCQMYGEWDKSEAIRIWNKRNPT